MPSRPRTARAIALTMAGVLLAPAGALAQHAKTLREELPESARRELDAANDLFDSHDYRGAAVEYLRAYDLSKNPRVLYNVAIAEKAQGHYAKAAALLRRELDEGKTSLTAAQKREANDAITILNDYVSQVEITANEQGAEVRIDGEVVGTTPVAAPVPVDVGHHTVEATKAGFKTASAPIDVARGKMASAALQLVPETLTSHVTINVTGAPAATIWIDGIDRSRAPLTADLPLGRHTIEARAEGFVSVTQSVTIDSTAALMMSLSMSEARHEGKAKIQASPAGAEIEIDGKRMGESTWEGVLPSGAHQLVVRKRGYLDYNGDLVMTDGAARNVRIGLDEDKGRGVILWTTGSVLVVTGAAIASYFVFRAKDPNPVVGTFDPGLTRSTWRFR